jgi:hypothetical protein
MMKSFTLSLAAAMLFLAAADTVSSNEILDSDTLSSVMDFGLIDHRGDFHRLYYYENDEDTRAIALFVQGNGCPLVQKRFPQLHELAAEYGAKGVKMAMINSCFQDTRDEIVEEADEFDVRIPILIDSDQLVGEMLGLTRTAEMILIDPRSWNIVFRGPVDDRLNYEKELPAAREHYFRNAVDAFLAGEKIEKPVVPAVGCLISFPDRELHEKKGLTYATDIAPILMEKCVRCHTKGGIGPFAMSSHRKVRGWMDMIEEVVLNQRMPPWQADPHYGEFSNDFSLTPMEKKKLIHWIRDGAVMEEGSEDPLDGIVVEQPKWAMGEPDHILAIPRQEVPAQGIIDYRYIHQTSPFDTDVWVSGVNVIPGNTKVVHHIIAYIKEEKDGKLVRTGFLAGYAPGYEPREFPENSGRLLPKGAVIEYELHYTACGTPETDQSLIGLYLHPHKPQRALHTGLLMDHEFSIPPHNGNYKWSRTKKIKEDITIYDMNPHMHLRGKAMKYVVEYPNGTSAVLLSVPHYNFNWQRSYVLEEPAKIPAGSKLTVHAVWDNSILNPANPDPSATIGWGEQSFDEMFFATYSYTVDEAENGSSTGPFSLAD